MTHAFKRQCLLPASTTSLVCTRDTPCLGKGTPIDLASATTLQQYAIAMAQSEKCVFDLQADGKMVLRLLKSYHLPNEIMANILDHVTDSPTLYQCTLASKRCYTIANPLLWKAPNKCDRAFIDCMLGLGRPLGHLVRRLDINDDWEVSNLQRLLPHLPQLTHIEIDSNDACAGLILQACPHLVSLSMREVDMSPGVLAALSTNCPNLDQVGWCLSPSQSPSLVNHLRPYALRLLGLICLYQVPDTATLTTIRTFDQLTSLQIVQIEDNPLTMLIEPTAFPLLTSLELHFCSEINDAAMIAFLNTHPRLEQLDLIQFTSLTNATLDAICRLPRLSQLCITHNTHFTTDAVRRIIYACPLTYLDVSFCDNVASFPESNERFVFDKRQLDQVRHP